MFSIEGAHTHIRTYQVMYLILIRVFKSIQRILHKHGKYTPGSLTILNVSKELTTFIYLKKVSKLQLQTYGQEIDERRRN